jgi:hypothetical protein
MEKITKIIVLFATIILILSLIVNLYLNWKLHLIIKEKERYEMKYNEAEKMYDLKQLYYEKIDSALNRSLSARINNTYITNIYKNEKAKKDIINSDSITTDSLFAIEFEWAKQRYAGLFK